jgi:hypothetical protein
MPEGDGSDFCWSPGCPWGLQLHPWQEGPGCLSRPVQTLGNSPWEAIQGPGTHSGSGLWKGQSGGGKQLLGPAQLTVWPGKTMSPCPSPAPLPRAPHPTLGASGGRQQGGLFVPSPSLRCQINCQMKPLASGGRVGHQLYCQPRDQGWLTPVSPAQRGAVFGKF